MNERISNVIHHGAFVPVVTGISTFAAGLGLGYFLGRRQMERVEEESFVEDLVFEIEVDDSKAQEAFERAKAAFTKPEVVEDIQIPPPVVIDAEDIEKKVDGFLTEIFTPKDDGPEDEEPKVITSNVFAGNDEDWDYAEEKAKRSDRAPYILHRDEFYAEENVHDGYSQVTLTYYAGDNVLVDEDDSPVMNYGGVVGEMKFGHGSGDPNVVYIRNDVRNAEYEIVKDPGLFSVEVLGLEIENNARVQDLKHSNSPRRMRSD